MRNPAKFLSAFAGALLISFSSVPSAESAYRVDPGASLRNGSLKVEPSVVGPAGKRVRYQIEVRREGGSQSSNSSQAGSARLDDDGRAQLASSSVSVQPHQRYEVVVKLYEGDRLVAEESVRQP
jgi:hypothetical protein